MAINKYKLEEVFNSKQNKALKCLNCYSKIVKTRSEGKKTTLYFETWECRKSKKINLKMFLMEFNVKSFTSTDTSECTEYFRKFDT